ncbi:electron transfer flavoprotein subunit beta/FixA family protein [Natronospora cellulosivora (SeqCode)]
MNIVVCIKQVPDTSDVKIDKKTNTLIRSGVKSIINPYDMHALEEALRLREEYGGKVTVISMGPSQVVEALKETISMGADEVILLSDRAFAGADTLATSYTLAKAIEKIKDVDLIFCGKQAIDGDTAQVGPGVAEHLNIPHATYVKEIQNYEKDKLTIKKEIENGYELLEINTPALLTFVKDINEVRFPSIRGILRSKEIKVPIWTVDDLDLDKTAIGLDGSPTQVIWVGTPELEEKGEIFEGKPEDQVNNLLEKLYKKRVL